MDVGYLSQANFVLTKTGIGPFSVVLRHGFNTEIEIKRENIKELALVGLGLRMVEGVLEARDEEVCLGRWQQTKRHLKATNR